MDFIAIDFETANHNRSSACQIGLAKVINNRIVETKSYFIKPTPDYYEPINVYIHGISDSMTSNSPTFDVLWSSELSRYLDGFKLVAHNAPFEKSVFNALSRLFDIEVPYIFDTLRLSRYYCPELLNYRLDSVCNALNIHLEKHHDAESDAVGCAQILTTISNQEGIDDIDQLFDATYSRSCSSSQKGSSSSDYLFHEAEQYHADDECIKGKVFCFTGALSFIRRDVAAKVIEKAGGVFKNSMSQKVDFLVVGDLSFVGGDSGKMKKVRELREKGSSIEILTESQFAEMVIYEGKSITPDMVAKDSQEFLEANRYNIFVGKNVCVSEGFPKDMMEKLSHRGASTGVTFWEDEAGKTDFFLISNSVLEDIKQGVKSPRVIRMENAMNKQANPEGNPENHHMKFIDEPSLMLWFNMVEAFLKGERKMRLGPLNEPQYLTTKS